MKPVRFFVVASCVVLAAVGLQHAALAASCGLPSPSTVAPGGTFTVSGFGDTNGEEIFVYLDRNQVGTGFTNATGTPITFTVVGTVPASTSPNTQHVVEISGPNPSPFVSCGTITVAAAATPAPTPAPVPTPQPVPTPAQPVATFPVVIPITVSQQQQQQQQQQAGGGGGAPARPQRQDPTGAGGQQQQQQQQQQSGGGGGILPRTGADAVRSAEWGGGLLAFGLVLVAWARRRRRKSRARALAELPPIDAVIVEPDEPWMPGTAHPSEFLTEADALPPVYLPVPAQLYLPAPQDDDVLTPSF
jgi:hypothetical protein